MSKKNQEPRVYCSVMGCKVTSINSPGTHFYSFPSLPHRLNRRQNWIDAVRNHDPRQAQWQPTKCSRICSHHFIGNEKSENPMSPGYNPTIFPEVCHNSMKPAKVKRCKKTDSPIKEHLPKKRGKYLLDDKNLPKNNVEIQCHTENAGLPQNSLDPASENHLLLSECLSNLTVTKNQGNQVNFPEKIGYHSLHSFSCKLYITDTKCEAEVQTCLQNASRHRKERKDRVNCVDKSSNTDFRSHHKSCQTEIDRNRLLKCFYEISSITGDREMLNIAGTTLDIFHMLLKILNDQGFDAENSKIPLDKSLLIFLMRMKTGLPFSAISAIFGFDRKTISQTFYIILMHLATACKRFVFWPSRDFVQRTMPDAFKQSLNHCRVIIDCFEIPVDEPSSDKLSIKFFSDCTGRFTIKVLVGYAPNGVVSFVSRCYPGGTTVSEILNKCGILKLLKTGETVVVDKAFLEINEIFEGKSKKPSKTKPQINVVGLPFTKTSSFVEGEVEDIDKIRKVGMHLKKIVRRIRTYKILNKLQVHMFPDSDSILFMCCVLVNCQVNKRLFNFAEEGEMLNTL